MEVIIVKSSDEVADLASRRIKNLVEKKPKAILGLATGNTPLTLYAQLIEYHRQSLVNFSQITTFNLDEYVGLDPQHRASYCHFMKENLFGPLGLDPGQCFIPNGMANDIAAECEAYEKKIHQKGPLDLQLLGIGREGHIGFNEPGSSLGSRTRLKTLTETTRQDNASQFGSPQDVPLHVITMGVQTIMEASEILLMATGLGKAQAVASMVEGPLSASVPASVLQFHPKTRVIVDDEAASKLSRKAYYREVYAKKPPWQSADFV